MELHAVAIRALIAWLLLWLFTRLSGKETVSQLSGRTLVVTLVLSDLGGEMAFANVPAANFVVAAGTIVLVHAIVSLFAVRSDRAHDVIEGPPKVVLSRGRRALRGARSERISEGELEELLRCRGADRRQWIEIEEAKVEREGQISLLRHHWARPAQRRDVATGKRNGP